ncbi:MAG TPA: PH domain-containing protein [Candidatus Paceibacterota bacterium]|nr:PH domain-containing protein [Candidatus Paceibacterota bacterium]
MELELDRKYHSGKRTFVYLIVRHGWWLILIGAGLCYLAYEFSFGQMETGMAGFLANHPNWYLSDGMLSQWILFAGVAFLLIAYLRASVIYRAHSFHLDEHALHLRRGLIRVQEITIPYHQINNIHIEQPYHWRFLGLALLDITIASSHTSLSKVRTKKDFLVPHIDTSIARALSRFLVRQASGEDDADEFEEDEDSEDISIEEEV